MRSQNSGRDLSFARRTAMLVSGVVGLSLTLGGCASTLLNYNTLDLGSTLDELLIRQVIFNVRKFSEDPYSIPSQVAIPAGTVSTSDAVNSSVSFPFSNSTSVMDSLSKTTSTTLSSMASNASGAARAAKGGTLGGTGSWTQAWTLDPLTDPDQLRRLRALYQYGVGALSATEFECEYPIIGTSTGGNETGAGPSTTTISGTVLKLPIDIKKTTSSSGGGGQRITYWKWQASNGYCFGSHKGELQLVEVHPDTTFIKRPGCVLCEPLKAALAKAGAAPKEQTLVKNEKLRNDWLVSPKSDAEILNGAREIGTPGGEIRVNSEYGSDEFYQFVLFVVEASAQGSGGGGPSGTGGGGQGSSKKTPATVKSLMAPLIVAPSL